MKTLVFLLVVFLAITFVTSANHNRRHGRKETRNNVESDPEEGADVEWPSPQIINDFTVPDEYTHDHEDERAPVRNHGKNRNRSH